jgi:putative hemolysin
MGNNVRLILLAGVMTVLASFFNGAETGAYRLSRLRLRLGVEKRQWFSVLLGRVMQDGSGLLLTLLVGTNLSHYIATSAITTMFLDIVESAHAAELYAALLTAPMLFVFSELIPKNVFLYRADVLMSLFAPLLYVSHKVFTWCGAVPLLRLMSNLSARLIGSPASSRTMMTSSASHHVRAILRDTQEEGLLSRVQTEMIDRIVNIPGLRLSAVMVPLARIESVSIRSDRAALMKELRRHTCTRLLVWDGAPTKIVGFVNLYDVLGCPEPFTDLETCLKPIRNLGASTPIIEAVDLMRREELKIVLVMRRRGKRDVPVGIVTMKDLVEELMGELAEW